LKNLFFFNNLLRESLFVSEKCLNKPNFSIENQRDFICGTIWSQFVGQIKVEKVFFMNVGQWKTACGTSKKLKKHLFVGQKCLFKGKNMLWDSIFQGKPCQFSF